MRPLWERDKQDRPLIPSPDDPDQLLTYRRVSTFARALDQAGGLPIWMASQAVKGAVVGGDEGVAIAKELAEVTKGQKARVERLVELAGGNRKRDIGTQRHTILASVLTGQLKPEDAPDEASRAEITRLVALIDSVGTVVDLEVPIVNHRLQVAGSADYVLDCPDGTRAVIDLKTGDYKSPVAWAIQVGAYASGLLWEDGSRADNGREPAMFVLWAPQGGKPKPKLIHLPTTFVQACMRAAVEVKQLRSEGNKL
jgi:hypothetical protein